MVTPKHELIDEIKRLAKQLGKTPTAAEMDDHGKYSSVTYYNRFDSWNQAVHKAGLVPNPAPPELTDEDLLDEIKRLADELGKTPSIEDMHEHGKYGVKTYFDHFNRWNNAVEQAGLEPNPRPDPIPDEALLNEIRRLTDELGETPSKRDMQKHGAYSHTTYFNHFGTWNNAVEQAGIQPA